MTVDEKIIALVDPEHFKHIPKMVKKHAINGPLSLIKREHADLYKKFEEGTETKEDEQEMSEIINGIFIQRMKKHGFIK